MIEARKLVKVYDGRRVLDGASLRLDPGDYLVLTGDNGAGKTTLLHVLMGLRRASAGRLTWKGRELVGAKHGTWRKARERWGFLPQQVLLPGRAKVNHLLRFHARLRGRSMSAARQWLERVGLSGSERQMVGALSGGMQQRLGIALTLFHEPELIVMDEPASSLDPTWREQLSNWFADATVGGAMALITSQVHTGWGPRARFRHCAAGRIVDEDDVSEK